MSVWKRVFRKVRKIVGRDPRLGMIDRCASGAIPVTIALMNLATQSTGQPEIEGLIRKALASKRPGSAAYDRLRSLEELARRHPGAPEIARRITGAFTARPEGVGEVEYWSSQFDRAVEVSGEASVALYCFGDPLLLRQITEELVARLVEWEVLRPTSRVLDYGCGIGRVTRHLAGRAAQVVGVDISAGMLREAGLRLAGVGNVRLDHAQNLLADKTAAGFDLILLVDVCPYLADATPLLSDLSARLAVGASLIVMNWAYSLPAAEQQALARDFARQHGLVLERNGTAEFALWDGLVFHFLRPVPAA